MDNAGYVVLGRQSGLMARMRTVANNVANAATTGYRAEGLMFSETLRGTGSGASLSMATARVHVTDWRQGGLERTGGPLDLAIAGDGFFLVQTPGGQRLTRAGSFSSDAAGTLVTPQGWAVLDAGGAPITVPPGDIGVAPDGTISSGGQPVGQVGLVAPRDPLGLVRAEGASFDAPGGFDPAPEARVAQGFLEGSNVDPVLEVARMIEVSRAYELGQGFLTREDERIRAVVQAMSPK